MADCPEPLTPIEYAIGVILFMGTIVSFLPQIYKLAYRKSHVGLSILRLCLALVGTTSNLLYYSALSFNQTFYCCTTARECFSNLQPILQIYLIISCEVVIISEYLFFFDRKWLVEHKLDPVADWNSTTRLVTIALVCQSSIFICWFCIAIIRGFGSYELDTYGTILIGFSSIISVFNIGPQIYQTFILKTVGALSLLTVFTQAVGASLTAIFYSFTNPWYIFLPPFLTSFLLFVLFFEALYFHLRTVQFLRVQQQTGTITGSEKEGLLDKEKDHD